MTLGLIRFFLLKHLTQKLYADSISAVSAPTSGGHELIKIELQIQLYEDQTFRLVKDYQNKGFSLKYN